MKESGVESLCGCKAAPIQCNPPDSTNINTNSDNNTEIELNIQSICGCKAAPIQCNPPDETVHRTNNNTNSDRNTMTKHKYFTDPMQSTL